MKKFGIVVIERATDERWTYCTCTTLKEAEDVRETLEAKMPGAVIQVHDWSDINLKKEEN